MDSANATLDRRAPWSEGKLIGQKPPRAPKNFDKLDEFSDVFEHPDTRDVQSRSR